MQNATDLGFVRLRAAAETEFHVVDSDNPQVIYNQALRDMHSAWLETLEHAEGRTEAFETWAEFMNTLSSVIGE